MAASPLALLALLATGCGGGAAALKGAPLAAAPAEASPSVASAGARSAAAGLAIPPPVDASVVPADRRTIWNPGIPGGIPAYARVHATVDAATHGNGTRDASGAIQAALDAAGAAATASSPRVVYLPAGRYRLSRGLRIDRSHVVLRGAGKGKTILDNQDPSHAAVDIGGGQGFYGRTPVVNVVGSVPKGASRLEVADASGFAVGDILQLDQLADGVPDGPTGWVWILDAWWSLRSPYASYPRGGGLDGKFPDSPDGYRPISQRVEVLARDGNLLTIHDPASRRGSPAHLDYPAAQRPQVWRVAGERGHDVVRWSGLEDLTVWSRTSEGDAKDMLVIGGAAYCWIANVETDGTRNTWAGRHVHVFNSSYRCEIRRVYSHGSSNYQQGSNAYGIVYSGSECLVEDNVVRELNKPIMCESGGGGNVVAYNYVDEAVIGSLTGSWQEAAISTHASFCHSDLFEGNHTPNVGADATHGNNGWLTMFRNWATGRNGSGHADTYNRAVFSDGWNREMTSIGNVLWSPASVPDHLLLTPSAGVNPVHGAPTSVYLLGSNAWVLGTGRKPGADHWDDGQAARLFHRHLDFDYRSNAVHDDPANPVKTLPDSLYLTAKPAFFGAHRWPWVDPAGPIKVHTLPARARWDAGRP